METSSTGLRTVPAAQGTPALTMSFCPRPRGSAARLFWGATAPRGGARRDAPAAGSPRRWRTNRCSSAFGARFVPRRPPHSSRRRRWPRSSRRSRTHPRSRSARAPGPGPRAPRLPLAHSACAASPGKISSPSWSSRCNHQRQAAVSAATEPCFRSGRRCCRRLGVTSGPGAGFTTPRFWRRGPDAPCQLLKLSGV